MVELHVLIFSSALRALASGSVTHMIKSFTHALTVLCTTGLLFTLASTPAGAAPIKNPGTLRGTISWSISISLNKGSNSLPGRSTTGSFYSSHTLKIAAPLQHRKGRTYWVARSKMPYTMSYAWSVKTTDAQDGFWWLTSEEAQGAGSDDVQPVAFGVARYVLTLDKRTKGLSVSPSTEGRGTYSQSSGPLREGAQCPTSGITVPNVGFETAGGHFSDVWGKTKCVPMGLQPHRNRPNGGLIGQFYAKKRVFDFTCSRTTDDHAGNTTQITVKGIVRYRP